jgi:protein SCO1/2
MRVLLLATALALASAMPAAAHDSHKHGAADAHAGHGAPKPAESQAARADVRLLAAPLLDQAGKKLQFPADVFDGRIVVMDFVYTECTTVCPLFSSVFAELQDSLGARLGKEVVMVSLSIDPLTDTPPRLARAAKQYGAQPGWTWLTGAKPDVDRVLKGLGAYVEDIARHPGAVLVGDPVTGQWTRFFGAPNATQILDEVAAFEQRRAKAAGAS